MKIFLAAVFLAVLSFGALAQDSSDKQNSDQQSFNKAAQGMKHATPADNAAVFDSDGTISRGAPLGEVEMFPLREVLEDPGKFAGMSIIVEGVIVRSCTMEGCWAELAPSKDSKTSVRVTFKDHGFFIPLKSVGFDATAEGVVSVKVLSKDEVDHLVKEGGKFDKLNDDGSATVISFVATGIVLTKDE